MDSDQPLSPRRYPVSQADVGRRLDKFLCDLMPGVSRTRIQELIRDGGVLIAGAALDRPAHELEEGQDVEVVDVPRSRVRPGGDAAAELAVVFEDEHLVVVDKPAGMVSHPTSVIRGGTVSERAAERWGELPVLQGEDRPGIVHRLDGETSGLMVLAKTQAAGEALVALFRERAVKKIYEAIVFGELRFDSDWITKPLGRSAKRSDRMSVMPVGEGLEAETYYETRERFGTFGHVACMPRTGRTHQIRVHMASIDHPLVADRVYRGRRGLSYSVPRGAPKLGRHALHASALAFTHPMTGAALELSAPLPADMAAFLEWLRARSVPEA